MLKHREDGQVMFRVELGGLLCDDVPPSDWQLLLLGQSDCHKQRNTIYHRAGDEGGNRKYKEDTMRHFSAYSSVKRVASVREKQ